MVSFPHMQWRPIAHKYRQGKMKSTLPARDSLSEVTRSKGSEKRVKSPNSYSINKHVLLHSAKYNRTDVSQNIPCGLLGVNSGRTSEHRVNAYSVLNQRVLMCHVSDKPNMFNCYESLV